MRHEYVEVPESQRLACLKFILKKEMLNWNNGNDSSEENENENSNENNMNNENGKVENEDEDISIKKDSVLLTKNVPIRSRKLLSRKEKIEPISDDIIEEKKEIMDSPIATSTSSTTTTPASTSTSTSYPSHYSPFPSAAATYTSTSSSSSFRPFQAVIFADDEDLALSVCETVKSVLTKNGKNKNRKFLLSLLRCYENRFLFHAMPMSAILLHFS